MPAVSKSQQRLFGMAYAVAKYKQTNGKDGLNPNNLSKSLQSVVTKLVDSMSIDELSKYAKTDTTKLPTVKEHCLTFANFVKHIY